MRLIVLTILSFLSVITSALGPHMSQAFAPMENMVSQLDAMTLARAMKSQAKGKNGAAALAQGKGGNIQMKGNFAQVKSQAGKGKRRNTSTNKGTGVAV